ncbi:rpn-5 [Pristionchus pacificus]|uniref:PCI domain-containing protein n=1 Tax=Pristionchus pacificus TaxID=54126 RepID=A0A8R1Z714_PRIPA|nr:rpn-5 [Pristionchus pacificus]
MFLVRGDEDFILKRIRLDGRREFEEEQSTELSAHHQVLIELLALRLTFYRRNQFVFTCIIHHDNAYNALLRLDSLDCFFDMPDKREPIPVDPIPTEAPTDMEALAHLAATSGDGRLFKMDIDYTSQVDAALPKAEALAKKGDVNGALDALSNLEKQTRLGSDMKSNGRIVVAMVKMCYEGQKWDLLNESILALSKKRLLIKFAIAKMVAECCKMVEQMKDDPIRMKLIETLRTVTAGKIYVENERARLTTIVVDRLEKEGKVDEAATMLLELQVETYGTMPMKEKVKYLLEQMRLSIARKDFIRASIIAKKISTRFFDSEEAEAQDLKLKFYNQQITVGLNDAHLKCAVIFVLLAQHSSDQWDMVHRLSQLRDLDAIPEYKSLLTLFMDEELISWKEALCSTFETTLKKGTPKSPSTGVLDGEAGEKRWKDLHIRVGEHNMRMISKYYTKISFERLAQLLDFTVEEMEKFVCDMIVSGSIVDAKLDRPKRVVDLRARIAPTDILDDWARNVTKLTEILNQVSHHILKEEMVHRAFDTKA